MSEPDGDLDRRGPATRSQGAPTETERAAAELGALVRAHPVGALATAVGVGYAVGGGLFTRFTSRLVRLALRAGVRFALLPLLERELSALAGGPIGSRPDTDRAPEPERTRH